MVDDQNSNGDVRRRHPTNDASPEPQAVARASTMPVIGSPSAVLNDIPATSSNSTQHEMPSDVPSTTATESSTPKVRFSTDMPRGLSSGAEVHDGPQAMPDIAVATKALPVRDNPMMRSPITMSPTTLSSPGIGPSSIPSRMASKTRDRGYSLRRTLFNRNIRNETDNDGVAIELDDSAIPLSDSASGADRSNQEKGKKVSDDMISVTLADDDLCLQPTISKSILPLTSHPKRHTWFNRQIKRTGLGKRYNAIYDRARKTILRIQELPPTVNGRHVDLDLSRTGPLIDERSGKPFISNTIRSSRYTLFSFFPRQLYAQFSKLANFYFLCVSILQMIPGLSTTGTYTTIVPLLIFVGISMAREGYDDLRRARLDKEENNREATVLRANRLSFASDGLSTEQSANEKKDEFLEQTTWQNIKVGDIVKLERNQAAPADLALIYAKDDNNIAYVETMALDGETNLKSKQVLQPVAAKCHSIQAISACQAELVVEDPNLDLYNFEGKITIDGSTMPLTNNEIIYRGSVLRNTPEAIGVVIYSGEECKIRMNANKNPRIKAPALQSSVNQVVILIVIFVVTLSIFLTVGYQIWAEHTEDNSWYLHNAHVAFGQVLVSFFIMFNTMIPLSLYVSLEIVKVFQMVLLNDIDMYDETTDTPIEPRTSTINEELGQVSYIFSDKTGTLTNNSMKFRKMSIAGTAWLHDRDLREEAERDAEKNMLIHKKRNKDKGKKAMSRKSNVSAIMGLPRKSAVSNVAAIRNSSASVTKSAPRATAGRLDTAHGGHTEEMIEYIIHRPHTVFARRVRFFILAMALCNTCMPEKDKDGQISFQAASPDEAALVNAAKDLGYLMVDRQAHTVTIRTIPDGQDEEPNYETYEVLNVIEFSSARKRMSVVVRMPDRRICVFCKGADTTLMKLLRLKDLASSKAADIERRASVRKSMEINEAIKRRSTVLSRKSSVARSSLSLSRRSTGIVPIGRTSSIGGSKKATVRDSIDQWLKERESDGDMAHPRDSSQYYTPRLSAQIGNSRVSDHFGGRTSLSRLDRRMSFQTDDGAEELVEEALVVNDNLVFERCFQHINDFASEGLRTLLYGHRYITEDEYNVWNKLFSDATTSLTNRQAQIEKAAEVIETQLELTGATAIEDKLQNGVPEAIEKLRRANIKLWMLTGDKRETAINIGHSCRLIKDYSDVIVLDHELGSIDQRITDAIIALRSGTIAHSVVVIDGATLGIIESEDAVFDLFIELAIIADSVICCRASPSQKASLVKAIRHRVKQSVTLAIGDGANDIAMIQEAHVGIGITGKEGLQAARCSDYSIAQFRFLLKLLLVHGRWNYNRVCKYTLGTFWKEMMFYLTQAMYQHFTGYTGTSLYESWSLSMFNTLFTSLPVIFMGIFEKDLAASTLLAVPELYASLGQVGAGFNIRRYLFWTLMAASEAAIIFFTTYALYGNSIFTRDQGLYAIGTLSFTACIILISTKMQVLEMHNKSTTAAVAFILSVGGWFLWDIILSGTYHNNTIYDVKDGILDTFGRNALWWFVLIVLVTCCVVLELCINVVRATFFPTDVDIFQALEQDLEIRKRFEEASADELRTGWDRGTKKSSFEILREEEMQMERERQVEELLARRQEMAIEDETDEQETYVPKSSGRDPDIPRGHSFKRRKSAPADGDLIELVGGAQLESTAKSTIRKSLDISELFSKGFGSVKK